MSAAQPVQKPNGNALLCIWHWMIGRWWRLPLLFAGASLIMPVVLSSWVSVQTNHQIYEQVAEVQAVDAALVLGTARYVSGGRKNQYFVNRIHSAVALYNAGKVKKIIISGDNQHASYNEPREMYRALTAKGVQKNDIVWDYAGFRTFDSVVRAYKVFGQKRLLIVSQRDHLKRALFIANHYGMDAQGLAADAPSNISLWMQIREPLARIKAIADLYLLDTQPKHLGKPISIFDEAN